MPPHSSFLFPDSSQLPSDSWLTFPFFCFLIPAAWLKSTSTKLCLLISVSWLPPQDLCLLTTDFCLLSLSSSLLSSATSASWFLTSASWLMILLPSPCSYFLNSISCLLNKLSCFLLNSASSLRPIHVCPMTPASWLFPSVSWVKIPASISLLFLSNICLLSPVSWLITLFTTDSCLLTRNICLLHPYSRLLPVIPDSLLMPPYSIFLAPEFSPLNLGSCLLTPASWFLTPYSLFLIIVYTAMTYNY
jgi:hypothetical protein